MGPRPDSVDVRGPATVRLASLSCSNSSVADILEKPVGREFAAQTHGFSLAVEVAADRREGEALVAEIMIEGDLSIVFAALGAAIIKIAVVRPALRYLG